MDVLLQRHCAKFIYVIPEGLRELMSDISREVLRSQPEEIYTFIADYLDALLITRENARVAARLVESITEMGTTIAELFVRTGMSIEEANQAATVIQVAFRKNLAERTAAKEQQQPPVSEMVEEANIITEIIDEAKITPEQAEHAAIIIQNAFRNFKQRQERESDLLKGMVDWRVAARSTMRLYRKSGVTYEEANRAATLIKAAYKGYYTRRIMKRLLEESEQISEESLRSIEEEEEGYAIYTSSWDRFGQDAEEATQIYEDIEAIKKEDEEALPEPEEDTETMALHIVHDLLKRVVPGSATSIPSGIATPPPSEIESEPQAKTDGGETDETSPAETSPEDGSPEQAVSPTTATTEEGEAETAEAPVQETAEVPAEETGEAAVDGTTEAPAEETPQEAAEAPAESPTTDAETEVVMSPDGDTSGAATDTEVTTSEMETETDATATEEA